MYYSYFISLFWEGEYYSLMKLISFYGLLPTISDGETAIIRIMKWIRPHPRTWGCIAIISTKFVPKTFSATLNYTSKAKSYDNFNGIQKLLVKVSEKIQKKPLEGWSKDKKWTNPKVRLITIYQRRCHNKPLPLLLCATFSSVESDPLPIDSSELASGWSCILSACLMIQSVNSGDDAHSATACRVDCSVKSFHSSLENFFLLGVLWKVE